MDTASLIYQDKSSSITNAKKFNDLRNLLSFTKNHCKSQHMNTLEFEEELVTIVHDQQKIRSLSIKNNWAEKLKLPIETPSKLKDRFLTPLKPNDISTLVHNTTRNYTM